MRSPIALAGALLAAALLCPNAHAENVDLYIQLRDVEKATLQDGYRAALALLSLIHI